MLLNVPGFLDVDGMLRHIGEIVGYLKVFQWKQTLAIVPNNLHIMYKYFETVARTLTFLFNYYFNGVIPMENGMEVFVQDMNELRIRRLQKKLDEKLTENRELKEICLLDNQIIHELEEALKELKREITILRRYKKNFM